MPFLFIIIFLSIFIGFDSFITTFLWFFFAITAVMSTCLVVATQKKMIPGSKVTAPSVMKPAEPEPVVLMKPVPVRMDGPMSMEKKETHQRIEYCEFCGAKLAPGVRFCQYCGAEVAQ